MAMTISSQMGQLTNAKYYSNHVTQWDTKFYQICQCIVRLAAININNVVNYCSNIHDLSFHAAIYADWQTVVYSDCVTLLHIVPLQFLLK